MTTPRQRVELIRDYWKFGLWHPLQALLAMDTPDRSDYGRLGARAIRVCNNEQYVSETPEGPVQMLTGHKDGCMGGTMLSVFDSRSLVFTQFNEVKAIGKALMRYGRENDRLMMPCQDWCIGCETQDPAICAARLEQVMIDVFGPQGGFAEMLRRVDAGDGSHRLYAEDES